MMSFLRTVKFAFMAIGFLIVIGVFSLLFAAIIAGFAYVLALAATGDPATAVFAAIVACAVAGVWVVALMRPRRVPERYRHEIPLNVRAAVMARDAFMCRHCGSTDVEEFEIDHVIPFSKGGDDSFENLQTVCRHCNRSKGARFIG